MVIMVCHIHLQKEWKTLQHLKFQYFNTYHIIIIVVIIVVRMETNETKEAMEIMEKNGRVLDKNEFEWYIATLLIKLKNMKIKSNNLRVRG